MNKLLLTSLVSAGLAAAVTPAIAQSPAAEGGPQARQFARGPHHGQRAFGSPVDRVEARLAYLRTALKITEAQEPQWKAFAEVRRKQARDAASRIEQFRAKRAERQARGTPPTAVERMERRQAMLASAQARLAETLAAAKPLYAALSPDQQRIADELLTPRGRGGHGHHGGSRGRA